MTTKSVKIIITETGEIKAEAIGFKGKVCSKAIDDLVNNISNMTSQETKPDWDKVDEEVWVNVCKN